MKVIYESGLLTVTKSHVDGDYQFFAGQRPIFIVKPQGMIELAEAIRKEEQSNIVERERQIAQRRSPLCKPGSPNYGLLCEEEEFHRMADAQYAQDMADLDEEDDK
jgi:hypothetical protein